MTAHQDAHISGHADAFRRDGFVVLENVFEPSFVEQLHAAFDERHPIGGIDGRPRGMLMVGDRRYMVTVALQPPFSDVRLSCNPLLLGVVTELLGAYRILMAFGAVVSQPGAEDQHVHSDTGGLFGDDVGEGQLPAYAITTIIPLVDMNDETGTTRVWPGSHRLRKDELDGVASLDPLVPRGSVLLMDFRLHHGGRRNRSALPRPILTLSFARPWFRDAVNFDEQPPLLYGPLQRLRMPPELRSLLPPTAGASLDDRIEGAARKAAQRVPPRVKRRLGEVRARASRKAPSGFEPE